MAIELRDNLFIDKLRGQWNTIYKDFGFDNRFLSKSNQPCPMCGGQDRFRFTDYRDDGWVICNQCMQGGLNGVDFLKLYLSVDFKAVHLMLKKYVRRDFNGPDRQLEEQREIEKRTSRLLGILDDCVPANRENSITCKYLAGRFGLDLENIRRWIGPDTMDWPTAKYYESNNNTTAPEPIDCRAMVNIIRGIDGRMTSLHVTYLNDEFDKLDCSNPKKIMKPISSVTGSGIWLRRHVNPNLIISEGLENLFAWQLFTKGKLIWNADWLCAVSANNMSKLKINNRYENIAIVGDNDENYTGHKAAYMLANSLSMNSGGERRITVDIPNSRGTDFCDVYNVFQTG